MMRGLLAEFGINIPEGLERALTMATPGARRRGARRTGGGGQDHLCALAAIARHALSRPRDRPGARRLCNEATKWHAAWQRSPALARSARRRWRPPSPTLVSSARPTVCGVARSDPAAELKRRQGTARTDQQNGRQIPTQAARDWRHCVVRYAKSKPETAHPHLVNLLARKSVRVATVAMANKMARIVWAVMTRGEVYPARPRAGTVGIAGRSKFS